MTLASLAGSCGPSPAQVPLDNLDYLWPDERFIIAFDIGNTSTSVTLARLTWGSRPLSPSSSTLRTVQTYPYSSPTLTAVASRAPSLVAYDRHDRPRAFGAECLTEAIQALAKEDGWIIVKGWKEQMRPPGPACATATVPSSPPGATGRKLRKGLQLPMTSRLAGEPAISSSTPVPAKADTPMDFRGAVPSNSRTSTRNSSCPRMSEGSSDGMCSHAVACSAEIAHTAHSSGNGIDGGTGALGDLGPGSISLAKGARASTGNHDFGRVHYGPRLRIVYADFLNWLVACARAWYAETTPGGDEIFVRCWAKAHFVFAIPSDWSTAETDTIRGAMQEARLLPASFEVGRLTFVKESVAITCFAARRPAKNMPTKWLEEASCFIVVDAAGQGVSITGYSVLSVAPRLKLRAYDFSRHDDGADAVLAAASKLLATRLARTKFKAASIQSYLLEEFRRKILKQFSGAAGKADYRLRVFAEGSGDKLEKAVDSGARIRDGWLTLSAGDVEACFQPAVDAIIARLSPVLVRGDAKHIILSGGFSESPYLVSRLTETFSPLGVQLVISDIPSHSAVSEGALAFYLSETLAPRRTRHALGVQVAVNWSKYWEPGMHERAILEGSGGRRLVTGKWCELVSTGTRLANKMEWKRTFHFRYRLAAKAPIFKTAIWQHTPMTDAVPNPWVLKVNGTPHESFSELCVVEADLSALIAAATVHDEGEKAWVQLQIDLVVFVGVDTLEVAAEWQEGGNAVRGPATRIPQDKF